MLDKQVRNQIRGLMQDPRWTSLEQAFETYLKDYFLETSYKRETEFNTLWELSFSEGGKYHLNNFMKVLEDEASKQ